jgi:outer membrane lipoprotein-sorting protein
MKKILVLGFVALFCLSGFAQKEPDAELILKAVADKALAYKSIQADFEYEIENKENKTDETFKGSMLLKGDKFRLNADGTITICDGKIRWVYLEESKEVNISKRIDSESLEAEERFLNNPLSLYTIYRKGFKYMKFGEETIDNKVYRLIDLSPEDINKPYFKVRCWISGSNDLYMMRYFQKDGTRITFKFKNFTPNAKTKDTDFVFQAKDYPGVEVIDMTK